MLCKPHILSLFPNCLINLIKQEFSCKIFYIFVFYTAGALIHDALSKLYSATKKNEIAVQIRELLAGEEAPEKVHIISQYLEILDTDTEAEYRYENEDWFEGNT